MRTHLLALAATLTVIAVATAAAAIPTSTASSGGSNGGVSAPSGGGSSTSGSSGGSGGASSGSSSHGGGSGGGGGAGGVAHAGGFGGGATYRGGGFEARSSISGHGNFASQGRDMAHGGYQVLAARSANVTAGAAISVVSGHSSLELGPAPGSAAEAARMSDHKRRVLPDRISHPLQPERLYKATRLKYIAKCAPNHCMAPREMCPPRYMYLEVTDPDEMNSLLDCGVPIKLNPVPHH